MLVRPCVSVGTRARACACARVGLPNIPRAGAILSATSLAPRDFSTLSHKRHDLKKKGIEHIMCV